MKIIKEIAALYSIQSVMYQSAKDEFTIVHMACQYGLYKIVHYFIDEHGFNVDFYLPPLHRLTLLHVIAKFQLYPFTDDDKKDIVKLIDQSNNLLLRNNFGKTIVVLAKSMNN